jgi:protein involved in polysaccharide export with SLBB domain
MKILTRVRDTTFVVVLATASLIAATLFTGIATAQVPQGSEVNQPANDSFGTQSRRVNQGQRTTTRVAAPVEQIRAVLVKDPGLLLELEHIVEQEAVAKGQLVEDTDLTQQAIFDRLDEDLAFRATATLVLQRYGYLQPNVNPDSDLGKEQELVLKERARRIVQIEAQEDAQSLEPQKREDDSPDLERAGTCDPRADIDCRKSPPRRFSEDSETGPGRELPATRPDISPYSTPSPQTSGSPLLQTRLSLGALSQGEEGAGRSDLVRLAAMNGSSDPLGPTASPDMLQRFLDNARNNRVSADDVPMRPLSSSPDRSDRNGPLAANSSKNHKTSLNDSNGDLSQGTIVHTPNPYSDVPSLIDLYVQVAAQNRAPERFGVDILRENATDSGALPMDLPVGPDYVVGPGDGLAIDLWGGMSQRLQRTVDSQGRISLPDYGPVLVSGKTLGDVQLTVQQLLRTQLRDVSTDVSLSRLRTVRVYVVGEVASPGAYDVSSLSSPLNALVAAGGVTRRGSLRAIKHFRGKQLIEVVDAYDLLLRGVGPDEKRLENGDSLLVPPVGPQVTIEGMVRRPAIYELSGNTSLTDALDLAGGVLPAAAMKHIEVERLVAHENRTMFSLDLSETAGTAESTLRSFQIQDGDRIHIFPIAPYNDRAIYLQGHVLRPGRYSYTENMTVRDLITSYSDLLPEPAGKYAEIIRLNPPDLHPTVQSFDLTAALSNPENAPKLKPLDTVRIFSRYDFESAPKIWVDGEVRSPGLYVTSGQTHLRDALYLAGGVSPDADLDSAQILRSTKNGGMKVISANLAEALAGDSADNPLLQSNDRIIVHRNVRTVEPAAVYVEGDVPSPGRYPLAANMHVDELLRLAGGLKPSADSHTAVLTHHEDDPSDPAAIQITDVNLPQVMARQEPANRLLANGDVLTIRENPGWHDLGAVVTLRGEVQHPGTYGIRPGESLGSVLEKAGGFTPQAYVYGTVLTRREVRDLEMKSHDELVARLQTEQQELKALPENDADQKSQKLTAIAQADTALTQLETHLPAGRVVLQGTLDQKSFEQSAAKTPLRNGDVILVPKKPDYVVVQGQVFNGTAVGYIPGRSANWYLNQAGGFTELADKKAAFVIRADGSVLAAKNNRGMWAGNPMDAVLMPGDVIVVPEKAPKVGTRNFTPLMQTAQVATSIALAVAYLKP